MALKDDISICCFRWNNWQGEWGPEYVNRLYRAVERNLSLPHRFVCFTDDARGLDPNIELGPWNPPSLKGWLPTLQAYSPDSGLTGRIWILDCDIIITNSIDKFFGFPEHKFINRHAVRNSKSRKYECSGEGVMFDAGFGHDLIWEQLKERTEQIEKHTGGDDRPFYDKYVMPHIHISFWDDLLPNQFISFQFGVKPSRKTQRWHEHRASESAIISFHGRHKTHIRVANGNKWIERNWY